jgi:hypothetical protein
MYIVGFNGPPECGKDTQAEMLAEHMDAMGVSLPVKMEGLKLPLQQVAYAMVGRNYVESVDGADYAKFKNEWFPRLERDGRHLMIDVSEKFLKPTYGIDVLPKMLLDRNKDFHGVLLVRDCGFQSEVNPLSEAVGADNLLIVNIYRSGKSFEALKDSREWVSHVNRYGVMNDGTLDDLRREAMHIYGRMVAKLGWKL